MGNKPRGLFELGCGHIRHVADENLHPDYYCLKCDGYYPIVAILNRWEFHSTKKKEGGNYGEE